jgi:2-dehydropantoate 2-reductase
MRYIIIGAGAVGGAIGGRLFESGHEVVLAARGAHYTALREHGLRLATPERVSTLPIPAVDRPEALDLRPDDVLVLAVKGQDTVAALDAWADRPVAGAGRAADTLPIVCAQNGVDNERVALRRFRRVYGICVWLPSTYLEPGAVEAHGSPLTGILHLGRYPAGSDETAEQIAADLEKSAFEAPVHPDVMRWKYAKLLGNLGNAIGALCGRSDEPEAAELRRLAFAEGEAALTAAGIRYTSREEQAEFRTRLRVRPGPDGAGKARGAGSSWQSLTRATGSIESDYLNGEVVLLGRLHGVPTPVNALLQRLANQFARERRPAGTVAAADLLREVEAARLGSTESVSTGADNNKL